VISTSQHGLRDPFHCCPPILDPTVNEKEKAGAADPVDGAAAQVEAVRQEKAIPPDDLSSFAPVDEPYGFVGPLKAELNRGHGTE
jgi:hypothetical protein